MDELYKVPAALRVDAQNAAESKSIRIREAEDGPANSWSTGIAEVALPEAFRQRNIAATEAAADQQQEDKQRNRLLHQQNENNTYHRFHVQEEERAVYKHLLPLAEKSVAKEVDFNKTLSSISGSKRSVTNEMKSTDDAVMKRFRQQQRNRRR